ncbi:MAG: hypothetical protein QGH96_03165, partial [Desulfobacterales bacterium]|nr:hypothetical protein [Desulfobacterales bacterium]
FNVTILFSRRSENRKIPYVVVDFNAVYKTNFSACSLPKKNFLSLNDWGRALVVVGAKIESRTSVSTIFWLVRWYTTYKET